MVAIAGEFDPVAKPEVFTCFLRHATYFNATATGLNDATPWQLEVYWADLQISAAVTDNYEEREEIPKEIQKPNSKMQGGKQKIWR